MKTQAQENFPAKSRWFSRQFRKIITDYYNFARQCDDIADNSTLAKDEKIKLLDEAEKSLFGQGDVEYAQKLHDDFTAEHLDFSLAADLLTAFRQDAEGKEYQTWAQLLDYCKYSAVPVGRFILALYNENPSTYMPAAALCSVLQIVNHIQDLQHDVQKLNRIYIPAELMNRYKVSKRALHATEATKGLRLLLQDMLNRCLGLMKDAYILPSIVKSRRLKIYLSVTISVTEILIKKLYNNDVLKQKIRLSATDKIFAVAKGLIKAVTTRHKTLNNKGL